MNFKITIRGTNSIIFLQFCSEQTFVALKNVMYVNMLQKVATYYTPYHFVCFILKSFVFRTFSDLNVSDLDII